jgi:hypothetical protein
MDFIKKYRTIIVVVLPILILVIISRPGGNNFKSDAQKWAKPSIKLSNIISPDKIGSLSGKKLVISIKGTSHELKNIGATIINTPADSILDKKIVNAIRSHDGPVLLSSNDIDLSARLWMILSQMGCNNIYIVTSENANEALKYKFRPDTLIRPEI